MDEHKTFDSSGLIRLTVQAVRQRAGMSVEQMAERVGVPPARLMDIECGQFGLVPSVVAALLTFATDPVHTALLEKLLQPPTPACPSIRRTRALLHLLWTRYLTVQQMDELVDLATSGFAFDEYRYDSFAETCFCRLLRPAEKGRG